MRMAAQILRGHSNHLFNINYFLFAAAIAINNSAGRTQPDADDEAASGAGTTGASIVAGAGLPAKADAAAIANAVARAIFFILFPTMWRNVLVSWDTIFCGPHAYIICKVEVSAQSFRIS